MTSASLILISDIRSLTFIEFDDRVEDLKDLLNVIQKSGGNAMEVVDVLRVHNVLDSQSYKVGVVKNDHVNRAFSVVNSHIWKVSRLSLVVVSLAQSRRKTEFFTLLH
jgi:hypothetical protein